MITPQKLRENKIHGECENAKKKAVVGEIYVCTGMDQFEFVPAENISVGEKTIGDSIAEIRAEIDTIKSTINSLREQLTQHATALMSLAETIDNQNTL